MMNRSMVTLLLLSSSMLSSAGCVGVRRELTVESEPAGALVYINGEEVGRTPLTHPFLYYGTMDVKLRKDGYEMLEDRPRVWAPFWQVPPLDLITEAFSFTDRHRLSYEMTPERQDVDPAELVQRGSELRGQLQSSVVKRETQAPTTSATTE